MKHRMNSVVVAICACLTCVPALVSGENLISADQAKRRAREFSRKVGWEIGDVPVDRMQAKRSEKTASRPSEGGDDRWKVSMGRFDVDIDSHTGRVTGAYKTGAYVELDERTKDSVKITKTLANQRAKEYMRAAGIPVDEIVIESSEPPSFDGASPFNKEWRIKYSRTYKGYQFLLDGGSVTLDPLDGGLTGFGYRCYSPVPESTDVKITKDEATQKARDYLAEFGLTAGATSSYVHPGLGAAGGLKIVPHDDMWEYWDAGVLNLDWTSTRLAWELQFDAPWNVTRVYVDAENGSIVSMLMSYSESKPTQAMNRPALVKVDQITVCLADGSQQAVIPPGAGTDGSALVKSIHSLKIIGAPDCQSPIVITVVTPKRIYTFGYSAAEHRLVLLTKVWHGKTIKGNLAWETTKEFEDLIAKYLPH